MRHAIPLILLALFSLAGCPLQPCCPSGNGETATLTPFSGRFGYGVQGAHGLTASLTKENLGDAAWQFEGQFRFPTPGYIVLEPQVTVAESYPEQVTLRLCVVPPPPGTILIQVITEVHVSATISASNEARFTVEVVTCRSGPCTP